MSRLFAAIAALVYLGPLGYAQAAPVRELPAPDLGWASLLVLAIGGAGFALRRR